MSTDSLAQHPGRPWPKVRPHVAEHYQRLSTSATFEFLLAHHKNMWPRIKEIILRHVSDPNAGPLVLEGAALRPEFVCELLSDELKASWLIASDTYISECIQRESSYEHAPTSSRRMIERFIERSLMDNARIVESAKNLSLQCIDVEKSKLMEAFKASCLQNNDS